MVPAGKVSSEGALLEGGTVAGTRSVGALGWPMAPGVGARAGAATSVGAGWAITGGGTGVRRFRGPGMSAPPGNTMLVELEAGAGAVEAGTALLVDVSTAGGGVLPATALRSACCSWASRLESVVPCGKGAKEPESAGAAGIWTKRPKLLISKVVRMVFTIVLWICCRRRRSRAFQEI